MTLTPDFFNKLLKELDKKYIPDVKYYRDNKKDANIHYAVELFSNGCSTYTKLIKTLAKNCKDTEVNLHKIVSKYVEDFEGFKFKCSK